MDLKRIVRKIESLNAKTIGIQFPEGLKTQAVSIAKQIEDETGVTVLIFREIHVLVHVMFQIRR